MILRHPGGLPWSESGRVCVTSVPESVLSVSSVIRRDSVRRMWPGNGRTYVTCSLQIV